jgi:hypothetical protein
MEEDNGNLIAGFVVDFFMIPLVHQSIMLPEKK